jgi:hypothetical protein
MRPFLRELDAMPWNEGTRAAIMGGNAAKLLGLSGEGRTSEVSAEEPAVWPREVSQVPLPSPNLSPSLVAHAFPQTQAVFDAHGIPWRDEPVPYWEPIRQAAAVRGYGPEQLQRLLDELTEAVSKDE